MPRGQARRQVFGQKKCPAPHHYILFFESTPCKSSETSCLESRRKFDGIQLIRNRYNKRIVPIFNIEWIVSTAIVGINTEISKLVWHVAKNTISINFPLVATSLFNTTALKLDTHLRQVCYETSPAIYDWNSIRPPCFAKCKISKGIFVLFNAFNFLPLLAFIWTSFPLFWCWNLFLWTFDNCIFLFYLLYIYI